MLYIKADFCGGGIFKSHPYHFVNDGLRKYRPVEAIRDAYMPSHVIPKVKIGSKEQQPCPDTWNPPPSFWRLELVDQRDVSVPCRRDAGLELDTCPYSIEDRISASGKTVCRGFDIRFEAGEVTAVPAKGSGLKVNITPE